jgi:hypothetical protein
MILQLFATAIRSRASLDPPLHPDAPGSLSYMGHRFSIGDSFEEARAKVPGLTAGLWRNVCRAWSADQDWDEGGRHYHPELYGRGAARHAP